MPDKQHIMILAGETSGDAHAAEVVERIWQMNPDIRISGMGMGEMKQAGVEVFFDSSIIAVMGLFEPILILVMGAVVLIIVLAILLPIFNLNQLVG